MLQPDELTGVPDHSGSGGRWALLAAVAVTSIGIAFLNYFQMPGNAIDASVMTATPAPVTSSESVPEGTWAPMNAYEPVAVMDLLPEATLSVNHTDIPVAAEGDTPSVLITPTPKAKVDNSQSIGWPVSTHFVSSSFGLRSDPLTRTVRFHTGTDFPAACGLPVFASLDGTVSGAGEAGAYGNRVVINHGQRFGGQFITTYSHLQLIRAFEGQVVKRGDVIGLVGTTGRSTGCHLHFETIVGHQLHDAISLLLGEGLSSQSWPVGYFMPYGAATSETPTPTPSVPSGSATPTPSIPGALPPSSTNPGLPSTPPDTTPTSTPPATSTPPVTPPPSETTPPPTSTPPVTPPPSETTPPPTSTP
ncbi:MAG TPA: M23 family metallopeptidase, partial [Propionibacteriaceae bacterium]|nr:M23 family metallopeptidase [Propionibacteriaceae bacterium]